MEDERRFCTRFSVFMSSSEMHRPDMLDEGQGPLAPQAVLDVATRNHFLQRGISCELTGSEACIQLGSGVTMENQFVDGSPVRLCFF